MKTENLALFSCALAHRHNHARTQTNTETRTPDTDSDEHRNTNILIGSYMELVIVCQYVRK
jgi:hypothetical protein